MRDPPIEHRLPELGLIWRSPAHVEPRLLQPEELKMVDEKGADEDGRPAKPKDDPSGIAEERAANVPDNLVDWTPADEQNHQGKARREHVDAALGRRRYDARPSRLECRPCHDAVLETEQRD